MSINQITYWQTTKEGKIYEEHWDAERSGYVLEIDEPDQLRIACVTLPREIALELAEAIHRSISAEAPDAHQG